MYGKLFSQMYDGTLATKGPWQALVTFQQLIILADSAGIVDMTPESIARRTTIPLEIIREGIDALEQPDSESRSPVLEGRRITRVSDDRTWGWQIVNHGHYRSIRSQEERREYMRNYQRTRRAVNKNVNTVSNVNRSSKQESDTDTLKTGSQKRRTQIPIDFFPDFTGTEKATVAGLDLKAEVERFKDHHTAKGSVMLDWQASFRNWVSNAVKFAPKAASKANGGAWWASESGITAEGAKYGLTARPNESWQNFKGRIEAAQSG